SNDNLVMRLPNSPLDGVARPRRWNARAHLEGRAMAAKAENAFEANAVHPPRCSRVPSLATAADVIGVYQYVSRDHVGFSLVALNIRGQPRAVQRIEHMEKLCGLIPVPELRQCHNRPHRSMGVLAPVLANSRRVAFDVARVLCRVSKRGC